MSELSLRIPSLLAGIACVWLSACGAGPQDTSIPLDEVRRLNNQLATSYSTAVGMLEDAVSMSVAVGTIPAAYNPRDFDVAMVREVLAACFNVPLAHADAIPSNETPRTATAAPGDARGVLTRRERVGRMRPCNPPRLLALETYLQVVTPELREFLLQRTLEVDALRVNLNDVIPANLDALERFSNEATADAARLRAQVEARHAAAVERQADEATRAQDEQRYNQALEELGQIDELLGSLSRDVRELRQQRRQLVDDTVRNITALGTEP